MREIAGEKYKLAGFDVYQKGTLIDVFAKFCGVNETMEQILADDAAPKKPKASKAKPGTLGAILDKMPRMPRAMSLPSLSVQDIVDAVAGRRELAGNGRDRLHITDAPGVIKDLGPEKLAQVLVEMGEARRLVLEEGQSTFVPVKAPAPKA